MDSNSDPLDFDIIILFTWFIVLHAFFNDCRSFILPIADSTEDNTFLSMHFIWEQVSKQAIIVFLFLGFEIRLIPLSLISKFKKFVILEIST